MSSIKYSPHVYQVLASDAQDAQSELYSTIVNRTQYNYLPIAKNAHTWAKELLKANLQFTLVTTDHNKIFANTSRKFIVILRDPIERWIAGVAQCLSVYDLIWCRDLVNNDNLIKLLCDIGRIDNHTNLQTDVFHNLNIEQCIFFKCDFTLEPAMHHFIKTISNQNLVVPCNNYNRVEDGNESKQLAYQALTERLQDKEYFDKVNKYVSKDIKFLEYITENNLWYTARFNWPDRSIGR
jgi:hypothetical protein